MEGKIIIITGLNGAGKTTALKILEEFDYFCVDNVPYLLGERLLKSLEAGELSSNKLALGIDIRTLINKRAFVDFLEKLMVASTAKIETIFLDASDATLVKRYNLSRKKHPVSAKTLIGSIEAERRSMGTIKETANFIIDTSTLSEKALTKRLEGMLSLEKKYNINLHLQSFGFKYGAPIDLDLMFDVRNLPNPYYDTKLREKTGNDKEVQDYVMDSKLAKDYYNRLKELLEFLLPSYIEEGKNHLTVGIGCTGGQHRSVTIVNKLTEELKLREDVNVLIFHREGGGKHW